MRQSTEDKIEQAQTWLSAKYPSYWRMEDSERRLLAFAYLADVIKVRESGGNNRGPWVAAFLDCVGLGEGYAWCAAAVTFASIVSKTDYPKRPSHNPAAVIGWRRWAGGRGQLLTKPKRGDICMHRTTATQGHIGIVAKVVGSTVISIEGNTSSGDSGSQRDGGGLYRRLRPGSFWTWGYADVDEEEEGDEDA